MSRKLFRLESARAVRLGAAAALFIAPVCAASAHGGSRQGKAQLPARSNAAVATSRAAGAGPRFEDYEVALYGGPTRPPKWVSRGAQGEARDELGKLVDDPHINFAGKYFLVGHSCGTGCRYYTLTDLSSGRDLGVMDIFTTAEPRPKTLDGHDYLTELFTRPGSRMLVAQYHVELSPDREECRERVFLFENGRLRPITKTRRGCREF